MARDHDIKEAADIEAPVVRFARARGWMVMKAGKDGWPDRIFIRLEDFETIARTVWIEFKAPGEPPTTRQEKRIKELKEQRAEVYWFDNVEAACRVLR